MRVQSGTHLDVGRVRHWGLALGATGLWLITAWVVLRYGRMNPSHLNGFYARLRFGRAQGTLELMLAERVLAMTSGAVLGAAGAVVPAGAPAWLSSILLAACSVLLTSLRMPWLSTAAVGPLALALSILVGRVAREAWRLPESRASALAWASAYVFLVYNPPLPALALAPIKHGEMPVNTFLLVVWFIRARTMYAGLAKFLALPILVAAGAWFASSMGTRLAGTFGKRSRGAFLLQAIAVMAVAGVVIDHSGWLHAAEIVQMQLHAVFVAGIGGTVGWLLGELCVPPAKSGLVYTWWEVAFAVSLLLSSFVLPLIRLGVEPTALVGDDRWLLGVGATAIGGAALRIGFGLSYVQLLGALVAGSLGIESILSSTSVAAATELAAGAGRLVGIAPSAVLLGDGLAFTLLLATLLRSGGWRLEHPS